MDRLSQGAYRTGDICLRFASLACILTVIDHSLQGHIILVVARAFLPDTPVFRSSKYQIWNDQSIHSTQSSGASTKKLGSTEKYVIWPLLAPSEPNRITPCSVFCMFQKIPCRLFLRQKLSEKEATTALSKPSLTTSGYWKIRRYKTSRPLNGCPRCHLANGMP